MRTAITTWTTVAMGLALAASAPARQLDMAAVTKWQAARVVHYRIVMAFDGAAPIPGASGYGEITARDTVTVELDWDVRGNAVVGTPSFTNAATTVVGTTPGLAKCPPPTLSGAYEHFEASSIAAHPSGVELKGVRRVPAAQVPSQWPSSCAPQAVPARQEPVSEVVAVMSPMMLVMPGGATPNMKVAADRKSFSVSNKGWTWTYTPTLVK
ncbi:MAG: hypothetical protein R2708_07530 [Vicinamibacterales bacterium]